jgi:hypothetical protein
MPPHFPKLLYWADMVPCAAKGMPLHQERNAEGNKIMRCIYFGRLMAINTGQTRPICIHFGRILLCGFLFTLSEVGLSDIRKPQVVQGTIHSRIHLNPVHLYLW